MLEAVDRVVGPDAELLLDIRTPAELAFSPDGSKIAFASRRWPRPARREGSRCRRSRLSRSRPGTAVLRPRRPVRAADLADGHRPRGALGARPRRRVPQHRR
ncbi:MAG: PD40 domain-containing protein [Actinobacteria bacterium]|nr:PD40 domain-containing protein [Actinomycetota bacterium]